MHMLGLFQLCKWLLFRFWPTSWVCLSCSSWWCGWHLKCVLCCILLIRSNGRWNRIHGTVLFHWNTQIHGKRLELSRRSIRGTHESCTTSFALQWCCRKQELIGCEHLGLSVAWEWLVFASMVGLLWKIRGNPSRPNGWKQVKEPLVEQVVQSNYPQVARQPWVRMLEGWESM